MRKKGAFAYKNYLYWCTCVFAASAVALINDDEICMMNDESREVCKPMEKKEGLAKRK
jgi:hypothetical protein